MCVSLWCISYVGKDLSLWETILVEYWKIIKNINWDFTEIYCEKGNVKFKSYLQLSSISYNASTVNNDQ